MEAIQQPLNRPFLIRHADEGRAATWAMQIFHGFVCDTGELRLTEGSSGRWDIR